MISVSELVQIANAGGGVPMSAKMKSVDELVRIASAASGSGARINLRDLKSKSVADLVRIASAGKCNVVFNF